MNPEIKQRADSGDVRRLKYIFLDALDVDPTFESYREDYEYCCSKADGFPESHKELSPMTQDRSRWTDENYWISLKVDLENNFSEERFSHLREVAKVYYAEKVKRLEAERGRVKEKQRPEPSAPKPVQEPEPHRTRPQEPSLSKREQEQKRVDARKAEEEAKRKEQEEKARQEQKRHDEEAARKMNHDAGERLTNYGYGSEHSKGTPSKKALGIAAAAIAVIVLVLIITR